MTLHASDKRSKRWRTAKCAFVYLLISIFCAIFGAIYEYFSHEVYSYYMLYAFMFPLAAGALPMLAIALFSRRFPARLSVNLYNSGIAALTVGSLFAGALEIYGTTNSLSIIYWIVGAALVIAGILRELIGGRA